VSPDSRRVGEILKSVLESEGLRHQIERQSVLEEWPSVVGTGIGEATRPRAVSDGTLFVEVRSSAWLMELNLMRHEILARLNAGREAGGGIDRIVFVLAEKGGAGEE
jgi:predicted nucleic acid-binding Zn ribbon protein